jgi:Ca2+-binding EF-hand superfamily protein
MTYGLIITRQYHDTKYVNGLKNWENVTNILKNTLPSNTTGVFIGKYSSDNKTLGEKYVDMSNLYKVASSKTDKVLI